jgi:hypothetical protein
VDFGRGIGLSLAHKRCLSNLCFSETRYVKTPQLAWGYQYAGSLGVVDNLTLFGLFAVTAMLVTYAFERRSHWFVLAFAGSCVLGSIYGFLQGAWPFGLVEGVWAIVATGRWL